MKGTRDLRIKHAGEGQVLFFDIIKIKDLTLSSALEGKYTSSISAFHKHPLIHPSPTKGLGE